MHGYLQITGIMMITLAFLSHIIVSLFLIYRMDPVALNMNFGGAWGFLTEGGPGN
jgi:hypothetical protein